jgi:TetR/AcrR family transcriptional regulator, transcriptional repressor for nem operon
MSPADTKWKLTETALDLMLRQGYTATTVDEICETAGVSKGSFYHFFKTKQDIAVAALHKFFDEGMEDLMRGEYVNYADPIERAYGMIDYTAEIAPEHWRRGCLLACFANEMANTDTVLRDEVARLFREAERGIAEVLAPLAEITGRSPEDLARQYTAVIQGAIVLSRAYGNPELIRDAVQQFRMSLQVAA